MKKIIQIRTSTEDYASFTASATIDGTLYAAIAPLSTTDKPERPAVDALLPYLARALRINGKIAWQSVEPTFGGYWTATTVEYTEPPFGWDVTVRMYVNGCEREETYHFRGCNETQARYKAKRKATFKPNVSRPEVIYVRPLNYDEWLAEYGLGRM